MRNVSRFAAILAFSSGALANESATKAESTGTTEESDTISAADCDFEVSGVGISQEETSETEKTPIDDPLSAKLAQLDECLDRIGANSSGQSSGSGSNGSSGGGMNDSSNTGKNDSSDSRTNGGDDPASSMRAGPDARSKLATDENAESRASDPNFEEAQRLGQTADKQAEHREKPLVETPVEDLPHAQVSPERKAAEDNVARVLREAAETETDPELKKELWAEYENYVKSIGK